MNNCTVCPVHEPFTNVHERSLSFTAGVNASPGGLRGSQGGAGGQHCLWRLVNMTVLRVGEPLDIGKYYMYAKIEKSEERPAA